MKGQMFLIATIIIISGLFFVRMGIRTPEISRQKALLEMSYEKEFFENMQSELENSILFSANEKNEITNNAFDFMNFSRKKSYERGFILKTFFVGIYSNHSTNSLLVTTINSMGKEINVSLNFNGNENSKELKDYERWDNSYQFIPGNTYWLNITYDNSTRNLSLETSATKDNYFYYFDLSLVSTNALHKQKIEKKLNLP